MLVFAGVIAARASDEGDRARGVKNVTRSFGLSDRLGDDLGVSAEPVCLFDKLAARDLEDLHPAAALVVGRRHFERRD